MVEFIDKLLEISPVRSLFYAIVLIILTSVVVDGVVEIIKHIFKQK